MRAIDEKIELPFDVDKGKLEEIANATGAKISVANGVIMIEGDQAEADEAAGMISQLPKHYEDYDSSYDDPYASLEEGQRYSDRQSIYVDEYSVYDLMSFDEDKGKWKCKVTTYHFDKRPYRFAYTSHSFNYVKPETLIKMTKINKRK